MVPKYNKSRILITGSHGMLGSSLFYTKRNEFNLIPTSNHKCDKFEYLDITDSKNVKYVFKKYDPDYIVNCAAFTNVDQAEVNKHKAHSINVEGLHNIIKYSSNKSKIIHISSDFIFNGHKGPYLEKSLPDPLNYYGKTKLESENILIGSNKKSTIFRINGLYSFTKHNNFMNWVYYSLKNNKKIKICDDIISNPTYCNDLCDVIIDSMILNIEGIYNYGSDKFISKYKIANMIAERFNKKKELIYKTHMNECEFIAKRPLHTGLICDKITHEFDLELPNVQNILNRSEFNE